MTESEAQAEAARHWSAPLLDGRKRSCRVGCWLGTGFHVSFVGKTWEDAFEKAAKHDYGYQFGAVPSVQKLDTMKNVAPSEPLPPIYEYEAHDDPDR